MKEILILISRQ